MPERIVRRRRDGLVAIRRAGLVDRVRPVARDFATALGIVVLGTVLYGLVLMAGYALIAVAGAFAARALWRGTREGRAALRRRLGGRSAHRLAAVRAVPRR